jgi:zinc transport system permease protein
MLEIFHYSFMIRAFVAGSLIAVIAPVIGTFLVAKRYSLMADTLAHVSLAGVALGLYLGIYPLFTSILVAVVAAIIIERLRASKRISGETALAMFLSGGLAVAIVLISVAKGFSVDLFSYLFGSITTVRPEDLFVMGALGTVVLTILAVFYKQFMYLSFDEEAAVVSGVPVARLNTVLMILTALTVSLAMRVVGVLLIGALMVIPVVTAMQLKMSFFKTLLASIGLSFLCVVLGLFVSYYAGIASGGAIVVTALILFFITGFCKRIK